MATVDGRQHTALLSVGGKVDKKKGSASSRTQHRFTSNFGTTTQFSSAKLDALWLPAKPKRWEAKRKSGFALLMTPEYTNTNRQKQEKKASKACLVLILFAKKLASANLVHNIKD